MKKTVIAGMSGGVDSSVAAYLLKQAGYNVIGVILQIWQDDESCAIQKQETCCGFSAVEDARKVAAKIDIPFYVLNFKTIFKEKVINYFVDEYLKGRTPNPCNACNRYIKWEELLNKALAMEADYIATGHYANIVKLDNGRYSIRRDADNPKDQTYALCNLTQFQLEHTLMPLVGLKKEEVRAIAAELGLDTANKPDSQEICFISDNDYAGFIERSGRGSVPQGYFVDEDGKPLGRHKGISHYTIGQRKGLGMAFNKHMFVKQINPQTNDITLCDNDSLFSGGLLAKDMNYMALENFGTMKAMAKIRYAHKPTECIIEKHPITGDILCTFMTAQRAVTPGQSAVFYDDEGNIICAGTIEEAIN